MPRFRAVWTRFSLTARPGRDSMAPCAAGESSISPIILKGTDVELFLWAMCLILSVVVATLHHRLKRYRETCLQLAVSNSQARRKIELSNAAITQYEEFVDDVAQDYAKELSYCVIALNGEAGEVAEWYKKYVCRGNPGGKLSKEDLLSELGDNLWYITKICRIMDWSLLDVIAFNMKKLNSRFRKNSAGDPIPGYARDPHAKE